MLWYVFFLVQCMYFSNKHVKRSQLWHVLQSNNLVVFEKLGYSQSELLHVVKLHTSCMTLVRKSQNLC